MRNNILLSSIGGIATRSMACSCNQQAQQTARPNIVLFLVDDMGWQDTSVPFYNDTTPLNRRYNTPNM